MAFERFFRRKNRAGAIALLAGLFVVGLAVAGCGYRQEVPRLPDKATSIGIGSVKNRTATGQLDVLLKTALIRQLSRNPAFFLTGGERSQLILEIDLSRLDVSRARSVSNPEISSLAFTLRGKMKLIRRADGKAIFSGASISANTHLDFDLPVIETPALRDEGINDLVTAFARAVEERLTNHF
ncbi:MAG: hypothetical protein IIA14_00810 [SAR324 cluster bacterium]|nr:hypothetical protein [SAR324 cluster bacterium]